MFVTTTFSIEGYKITGYKGIVRGIIVRSPTIIQGFVGGLKNIIGGRIGAYTEMCEQARSQAYDLLCQHAEALGANAIVGMRTTPPKSSARARPPKSSATAPPSSSFPIPQSRSTTAHFVRVPLCGILACGGPRSVGAV